MYKFLLKIQSRISLIKVTNVSGIIISLSMNILFFFGFKIFIDKGENFSETFGS